MGCHKSGFLPLPGVMARGKATPSQPMLPPGPNVSAVQDILARARALAGSVKRDSSTQGNEAEKARPTAKAKVTTPIAKEMVPTPKADLPKCPPITRVRGKSPAPAEAAKPPPPAQPKAVQKACENGHAKAVPAKALPPAKAAPKASAPSSSSGSASQRTHQVLQIAKETHLAKQPPAVPDALKTPPAKSSFASPKASPPDLSPAVESVECLDTAMPSPADEEFHCSQVSYYGSKGQSWWAPGTDTYTHGKWWWWDPVKEHYVVTYGNDVWISKSRDWNGEWVRSEDTTVSAEDVSPQSEQSDVRNFLKQRQPTSLSDATSIATEDDPGTPGETSPGTAGDEGNGDDAMPEATAVPEGEPSKLPSSEAYRLDKHGNPISPEALYMRFYRRLRSFLIQLREWTQQELSDFWGQLFLCGNFAWKNRSKYLTI